MSSFNSGEDTWWENASGIALYWVYNKKAWIFAGGVFSVAALCWLSRGFKK